MNSKPLQACRQLSAEWITAEGFQPYGQVIFARDDGAPYDRNDAQLRLESGMPRFYIMRLSQTGRRFHRITRHQCCTQCLGSLAGQPWLLAVAPPAQASLPDLTRLQAFQIPGNCFVKLEVGTWHAGPYFEQDFIDFYNLELSDTNLVDHETYDLLAQAGLEFEIIPA